MSVDVGLYQPGFVQELFGGLVQLIAERKVTHDAVGLRRERRLGQCDHIAHFLLPGMGSPESRSATACLKPVSSARSLKATPSGL